MGSSGGFVLMMFNDLEKHDSTFQPTSEALLQPTLQPEALKPVGSLGDPEP